MSKRILRKGLQKRGRTKKGSKIIRQNRPDWRKVNGVWEKVEQ